MGHDKKYGEPGTIPRWEEPPYSQNSAPCTVHGFFTVSFPLSVHVLVAKQERSLFPASSFWSLAVSKNRGERPGRKSHMHDVRETWGGRCPIIVTHKPCVDQPQIYQIIVLTLFFQCCSFWTRYYKKDLKILHRAPPPSCLPDVVHVTLSSRPSPPFLHTASDQKLDCGNGLGTRLTRTCNKNANRQLTHVPHNALVMSWQLSGSNKVVFCTRYGVSPHNTCPVHYMSTSCLFHGWLWQDRPLFPVQTQSVSQPYRASSSHDLNPVHHGIR